MISKEEIMHCVYIGGWVASCLVVFYEQPAHISNYDEYKDECEPATFR